MSSDNPSANEFPNRLWIGRDWFIPIDEEGQCVGLCNEGALGFVLRLHSESDPDHHMALKLPRLMGETHRENAYISQLLEKELDAVKNVKSVGGRKVQGLINADVAFDSPLRNPIATQGGSFEAQKWDGALILVRYEKGKNPYFCLVKKENGNVIPYPDGARWPEIDETKYEELRKASHHGGRDWRHTVFVVGGSTGDSEKALDDEKSHLFTVDEALEKSTEGTIWYACLPSIMYEWADGTLQEAISLDLRGQWSIEQHLTLIRNVCNGLDTLHTRGMLHADVRPANIIYQGDPTLPDSYDLADYGSFAEVGARAAETHQQLTGGTVMGPIISGERTSAFYSSERRAGREREEADTAVILVPGGGSGGGSYRYIVLGWRSDLINDQGTPKPDVEKFQDEQHLNRLNAQKNLSKGDRLQIRDYIFDVVDEWSVRDKQILKCHKKFWKIFHGRIVVECTDPLNHLTWFPIPRSIELLQWSASTDLYSLGVLALYSLYRSYEVESVAEKEKAEEVIIETDNANIGQSNVPAVSNIKEERDFLEMLTYLANPSYFNAIWPEVEWLRQQLEENLRKDLTAAQFAQDLPYEKHDQIDGNEDDIPKNLYEKTEKVVSRITQTVPGTEQLVKAFDYDLGPFIFFIHFVLRCLHRGSDMSFEENPEKEKPDWILPPFCSERNEPTESGAARRALKRLEDIMKIIANPKLKGLKSDRKKITGFDPRPEHMIRAQWLLDHERLERLRNQQELYSHHVGQALEILQEVNPWNPPKTKDLVAKIDKTLENAFRSISDMSSENDDTPNEMALNRHPESINTEESAA